MPVDDGEGRAIWCEPCSKRRSLGRPFELQNWNSHCKEQGHTAAARLRASLRPAPEAEPEPRPDLVPEPALAPQA